jgi:hypothetical protein
VIAENHQTPSRTPVSYQLMFASLVTGPDPDDLTGNYFTVRKLAEVSPVFLKFDTTKFAESVRMTRAVYVPASHNGARSKNPSTTL